MSKKGNVQRNNLFRYLEKKTDLLYMQIASSNNQKYQKSTVFNETITVPDQADTASDQKSTASDETTTISD